MGFRFRLGRLNASFETADVFLKLYHTPENQNFLPRENKPKTIDQAGHYQLRNRGKIRKEEYS